MTGKTERTLTRITVPRQMLISGTITATHRQSRNITHHVAVLRQAGTRRIRVGFRITTQTMMLQGDGNNHGNNRILPAPLFVGFSGINHRSAVSPAPIANLAVGFGIPFALLTSPFAAK